MNITRFIPVAVCSFLLAGASAAVAQMAPMSAPTPVSDPMTGGFLGHDYAGVEIGYIRHHDGPPNVLHRYGFIASRPMPEYHNVDGLFRYNYIHGSWLGVDTNQHEAMAGLTWFTRNGPIAPFIEGDLGWAWSKVGRTQENSFLYSVRGGLEILVSPSVSLTPTVTFREARRFHDHAWLFGVKAGIRLHRDWDATFAVQADNADSHNVEFIGGVHRRF